MVRLVLFLQLLENFVGEDERFAFVIIGDTLKSDVTLQILEQMDQDQKQPNRNQS
ncbi:hypothetical protein WH47_11454 [Habropoda laboriosa]|uniref:Uncharacterized protein n=1 Tax=Habropoda laboriosa TaxID=597456 RepID=A0A0L7QKW9_9HYME|nr:hypothetical protein WH47_11454 [Habropoda laboriosa]